MLITFLLKFRLNYIYQRTQAVMTDFLNILESLEPISLEEMNDVKLLDRTDTKFTFHISRLPEILAIASSRYRVLMVEGNRYARYETRYFDTPDYEMFIKHHNGKLNRNKVRFRTYLDSGLHYFEVKLKTNKGRTVKTRVKRETNDYSITEKAQQLLEKKTSYTPEQLYEAIRIYYNRITLVSKNLTERLTIDFDLKYKKNDEVKAYPEMVIAEVKQDKSAHSYFVELMNDYRIKDIAMSKYCLGIASLVNNIKKNNFKPKISYVNKLCNTNSI